MNNRTQQLLVRNQFFGNLLLRSTLSDLFIIWISGKLQFQSSKQSPCLLLNILSLNREIIKSVNLFAVTHKRRNYEFHSWRDTILKFGSHITCLLFLPSLRRQYSLQSNWSISFFSFLWPWCTFLFLSISRILLFLEFVWLIL